MFVDETDDNYYILEFFDVRDAAEHRQLIAPETEEKLRNERHPHRQAEALHAPQMPPQRRCMQMPEMPNAAANWWQQWPEDRAIMSIAEEGVAQMGMIMPGTFLILLQGVPRELLNDSCVEAILEQAGLSEDVAKFTVHDEKVSLRGHCMLNVLSESGVYRCLNHFAGCCWGCRATLASDEYNFDQAEVDWRKEFDFRNSTLRHRYDSVKYVVKRLETIAYEVDLAQQRQSASLASGTARTASEDPPSEVKAQEPAETGTAVDLALLGEMKERYDKFTDTRDQVIKRSRDVGKAAKNAVYALQRADFKKADGNLALCAKEANNIWQEHVSTALTLRSGGFTGALEEVAEAVAYRAFLKEQKLLTRAELQQATGLSFELTIPEYLGGLMDLTGEVGRLAIRKASAGREAVGDVEKCLACVEGVFQGVQDLVYLPGGVGKKMGALRSTLLKIEGVLYELALLSHAGIRAAKAPEQAQQRDDAAEADDSAGL
ncbi:unnamed protein product [Symbiodinium necroappetens]|uniref:Translin n=1 Tax=Symbiodinium necroappetens TaxID=1628268 RepID=A0A812LLR2_9DINO|nr:unnamed protein product [Symbiodinium necroappetens]